MFRLIGKDNKDLLPHGSAARQAMMLILLVQDNCINYFVKFDTHDKTLCILQCPPSLATTPLFSLLV